MVQPVKLVLPAKLELAVKLALPARQVRLVSLRLQHLAVQLANQLTLLANILLCRLVRLDLAVFDMIRLSYINIF